MFSSVNRRVLSGLFVLPLALATSAAFAQPPAYLGFDRNDYPGDSNLTALHRTFAYAGYWLNNPPAETTNTWEGKRPALRAAGFGFLVLFNGRLYKELKRNPAGLGHADAEAALAAARREGFPAKTVIFLDIEEGGRMLPEQKSYIYAWADAVVAGGFRAGVYCSGIPAKEGKVTIITADDIRASAQGRKITFFVTNDVCPPSSGCVFPKHSQYPAASGVRFADIWQFAQSPRRKDFAAQCPNYHPDGNCYPPTVDPAVHLHVDLNSATTMDPSGGR
jgi:hypothetical protein